MAGPAVNPKRTMARAPSQRTSVRRLPARASYDAATIERILDEGLLCHVGFAHEDQAYVIPTTYARVGAQLFLHGSAASRTLRALKGGVDACVTVTLLDGLVLARSAFHHSMNYRSVMIFGRAETVVDPAEKLRALTAIVEHLLPGRSHEVRPPTARELKLTLVLKLPLAEASAKVRAGPPMDDEDDYGIPCWAGEIPLRLSALAPVADPRLDPAIAAPDYAVLTPG
jgi:nitroimidazol reductase NimA-like FMN-containing flavoprotein (pyridoxamine 5'-phosphate oxidase superfamily)